jgi:hypothetical protein
LKPILGSLVLGLFLSLAFAAVSLCTVSRDKAIAPNEAMATATVHPRYGSRSTSISYMRCNYTFEAGGNDYWGNGLCPSDVAASLTKSALEGLPFVRPATTATVYYDPNNPAINSLVEFSAKAANDYLKAKVGFGLAVVCILLLGMGVVIAARMSQPGGAIMVDTQGTMLYPDQIKSDPDDERFSAHPRHISTEETD